MNKNYLQIKEKLSQYPIQALAEQTGFQKRKPKKIEAVDFLAGSFDALGQGDLKALMIAKAISYGNQTTVSRKAIDNKLSYRHEGFVQQFFEQVLVQKLHSSNNQATSLFSFFKGVFVNDSSCLKMPENLSALFPGPHSHNGQCATARIQLRLDLLAHQYSHIEIMSYRDNDQKYAAQLARQTQAGELNIFDLGYTVLDALEQMAQKEAYFLCRRKFGTHIFHPKSGKPIDLLKTLKRLYQRGINHLDWQVLIGAKKRLPLRLVIQRVPQAVYKQRLEKAQNDRHQKANHSDEYLQLLAWTLLITNVPQQIWKNTQVFKAYQFRWRIEIIFKCWKSKFQCQRIFNNKRWIRPPAAMIFLYLLLTWLTLFFVPLYKLFMQRVWDKHQKWISIFKFADAVNERFEKVVFNDLPDELVDYVAYFCSYKKRKDRLNYLEYLYMS